MYSLRFDHGVTSAGFLLSPHAMTSMSGLPSEAGAVWRALLLRYPTLAQLFEDAEPLFPIRFHPAVQHRLTRAADRRWVLMPHAYAFIDPLFSTGIAWSLLAIERLALELEKARHGARHPSVEMLNRYDALLAAEANQVDLLVAGAYEAMAHFELFAAHTMLYFASVSFAEVRQRVAPTDAVAWNGFLGVDDDVLRPLPGESLRRLRAITRRRSGTGSSSERKEFVDWSAKAIAARNVAGLAAPERRNLYPVDLDTLIGRHQLLDLSRDQLVAALPALRGRSPEPDFGPPSVASRAISPGVPPSPAPGMPAPH
jgi:FADH2 O2-dependent halogenase